MSPKEKQRKRTIRVIFGRHGFTVLLCMEQFLHLDLFISHMNLQVKRSSTSTPHYPCSTSMTAIPGGGGGGFPFKNDGGAHHTLKMRFC